MLNQQIRPLKNLAIGHIQYIQGGGPRRSTVLNVHMLCNLTFSYNLLIFFDGGGGGAVKAASTGGTINQDLAHLAPLSGCCLTMIRAWLNISQS
jgi:hypothetical protein